MAAIRSKVKKKLKEKCRGLAVTFCMDVGTEGGGTSDNPISVDVNRKEGGVDASGIASPKCILRLIARKLRRSNVLPHAHSTFLVFVLHGLVQNSPKGEKRWERTGKTRGDSLASLRAREIVREEDCDWWHEDRVSVCLLPEIGVPPPTTRPALQLEWGQLQKAKHLNRGRMQSSERLNV